MRQFLLCKLSENKGMQKLRRLVEFTFSTFVFSFLYIFSCSVMLFAIRERERASVNMQTVLTLAGLKIVFTIMNLICRCLVIVRCDAVENYMFIRDSQLV